MGEQGSNRATAGFAPARRDGMDPAGAGERTALVCVAKDIKGKVTESLTSVGYNVTVADTTSEAVDAMRFHLYDVVVLDEMFGAASAEENEVLRFISRQNMSTRRRFFVAMTGNNFTTMDNMAAFNKSVNLVVNTDDAAGIGEAVRQGVADNASFYHVFNETLHKLGKI